VHLAWKSTLYVTNFPESADDPYLRDLFGKVSPEIGLLLIPADLIKYGTIFEIRWPSKKFKATRRFCYVQFTSEFDKENSMEFSLISLLLIHFTTVAMHLLSHGPHVTLVM